MSMEASAKAIFITNTFAQAHPEEHIKLWRQFEKEVPVSKRSGAYGVENMAYVRWLRDLNNQVVREFLKESIVHQ
ncbi:MULTISPECIES: hypothetical protein [Bacillus subtilis group]|uniref:hypothetical protein n=1 Tax=Bacillus subtilis group TaxID=653685 RepID=UPI000C77F4F5|nr:MULTISPECIES: hypothetical protein [Bacillus subtilis group]MCY1628299.1 hypothetical protein [Bacillus paralicheniformis]MED4337840.1 hypothetical protein [Bacillus licheniformis]MED4371156.1 hypothetical protein [Bacillus licheniformis]PLC14217.1 hypothetical protein BV582_21870 [Bacillus paralicheniformis]QAS18684.1 hypothetical protein EQJ69_22435 [Bacillus licheniformis]